MKENYSLLGLRIIGWKEAAQEESADLSQYVDQNIGVYTLEDKIRPVTDQEYEVLTAQFPDIGKPEEFAVMEVQVVTWKEDAAQEARELEAFAREAVGLVVLNAEIASLTDDEWDACLACEPEKFS
jgi:hypothetical protein